MPRFKIINSAEGDILELSDYMTVDEKEDIHIMLEEGEHKITVKDVITYYRTQAPNISSGIRELGNIVGDWRPIDNLASECLSVYKLTKLDALRKEAHKQGIEPRF